MANKNVVSLIVSNIAIVFVCDANNTLLSKPVIFCINLRSVYKELHADHETGTADNK